MTVFCVWFLKTFQSEECFQVWRQYNWVGIQHFHERKSDAKSLTQCVLRSKFVTILFFKIKFVLRKLLDSLKFIVFLWKFLQLEIDIPSLFLLCFMKLCPLNFDHPLRLNASIFLQTITADAQQRRVVGTSVAGIKAAAIGQIFLSPEGRYEVSSPRRPYRVNPEDVKTSLWDLHSACVQRRRAYADASVMVFW